MPAVVLLLAVWLTGVGLLAWVYRHELRRIFAEPVFHGPVLVIESDDWGAGPLAQAQALRSIATVLVRHRDSVGRLPVLNLGVVLGVVDGPAAGGLCRARIMLDDPILAPVLMALDEGRARGVFATQLHGLEHYRLASLLASSDAAVAAWLQRTPPAATEELPSALQSRWVDASTLPSRTLAHDEVTTAVAEEVDAYRRIFGESPRGVVPPTFVWTRETEAAWASSGLQYLVTPGWRYPIRGSDGLPGGDEGPFVNGDVSAGLTCIVRCGYFEPMRGRGAAEALRALARAASEGRVCVLENHRANFIGDPALQRRSLDELDEMLRIAVARFGDLRFMSTAELAAALNARDPAWIASGLRARWPYWWVRLRSAGRLWRLLRLTGLPLLVSALTWWLAPTAVARS